MKMIENKKIIRYLARKEYTGNWKRNLLTIVAIVLTTFLITTVCSLGGSYWKTVTRRSVIMEGIRYDVSLPQPTAEQVMKAYQIPEIKNAGLAVKCAVIREYKGKPLEIRLFWGDSTNWEKQCIPAFEFIEGTYPKAENEMILSTRSLNEMGIENPKIGMELPVKWESLSGDEVPNKGEGQFKLTGYYREYTGQMNGYVSQAFYQNTGAKQTDITQGMLYLTLQYSLYSESDIEKLGEKLNITERQMIYADTSLLTNFLKMISALGILMVLIFMSGYLFIYNILYISITKEVKHYGQLKALGMAEWQKNPDYNMTTGRLVGIDESGFDLLNRKMGNSLDKNAFLKGEIAILFPLLRETSAEETVGEELTFRILGKEKDVEHKLKIAVQNINSASPNYYGIGYGPSVVISNTLFEKWVEDPIIELVDIDYDTSFSASMDENVRALLLGESKLIVSAKMDSYMELYQTEVQMRILGNSLCIILVC